MNELQIRERNFVAPVLDVNFEEIGEVLDKMLEDYKGVIVTEDTLSSAKEDQRRLASLRTNIERFRKDKKRQAEEPIKEFEAECKALVAKISEVEAPIQQEIEVFNEKTRQEKREKAEKAIQDMIVKYGLTPKYARQLVVKDEYCQLSATFKSARQDIEACAADLKVQQDKEAKLIASLNTAISVVNADIEQKLTPADFTRELEFALGSDLGQEAWLMAQVREKAAKIRDAENALKEKARIEAEQKIAAEKARLAAEAEARIREEAERVRREAEEKAKAEEERIRAEERAKAEAEAMEKKNSVEAVLQTPAPAAEPAVAETKFKSFDEMSDDELRSLAQAESIWKMVINLTGEKTALAAVGEELKRICREHGVTYKVDPSQSKKLV